MKKNYSTPVLCVEIFETADVIAVSTLAVVNANFANATDEDTLDTVNLSGTFN